MMVKAKEAGKVVEMIPAMGVFSRKAGAGRVGRGSTSRASCVAGITWRTEAPTNCMHRGRT